MNRAYVLPMTTVSATGAQTARDVSAVSGDGALVLHIQSLVPSESLSIGEGVRIVLEESTNSFEAAYPVAVIDLATPIPATGPDMVVTWRHYQIPLTLAGSSGALMRVNIVKFPVNPTTLQLEAYFEY